MSGTSSVVHARTPAEVWPLASYLADEMAAREWTVWDVAARMSDRYSRGVNALALNLLLCVHEDGLLVGDDLFSGLAAAFGVNEQFFRNLDVAWRKYPDRRVPFECPEGLLA